MAKLPNPLKNRTVQKVSRPFRAHLNRHTTRVARQQVAALRTSVDVDMHDLRAAVTDLSILSNDVSALRNDVSTVRADVLTSQATVTTTAAVLDGLQESVLRERAAVSASTGELAGCVEAMRNRIESLDRMQRVLDRQRRDVGALMATFHCSLDLLLGPTGRYMTRLVSVDELRELIEEFNFVGDSDAVAVALHQAYRMLVELEARGIGRVAGSTTNAIAKLAAVATLPPPTAAVLEIGTLFGLGAVGVVRQLARRGLDADLTLVDPFAGYQMQPDRSAELDVSHTPVTRSVVEANLALGGVSTDRYRVIEGRSESDDTQAAIADRTYGLVIIDGDHGADAALNDLLLADRLAADGALVVLDDFGDLAWPGVRAALDEYLERDEVRLRHVGTAATSAFLRAQDCG